LHIACYPRRVHDWTLNPDADKRVTPELIAKVRALFENRRIGEADFGRVRMGVEERHDPVV
jgi:hypothetical protein